MASLVIVIAATAIGLATVAVLIWAGFRNGDFSGESLARALRDDLEAGAAEHDRR